MAENPFLVVVADAAAGRVALELTLHHRHGGAAETTLRREALVP